MVKTMGLIIKFCMVFVHFLHVIATPQTRTENGYTLTYENLDPSVPQTIFQAYVDMFFVVYPKQCAKYNPNCAKQMGLIINATYDGSAHNSASRITVGGNYAKNSKPNDIEVMAHETFHSVQAYPNGEPLWITEGLADYARSEFSPSGASLGKYQSGEHYTQKYKPAAKFFAYLENRFPGIIKSVDSIMRNGQQNDTQFWVTLTGNTVDELWDAYVQANAVVCSTGNGITTWNNAARDFALQLINDKRSQIANGTFTMLNGAKAPTAKNMNKLSYSCEVEEFAQAYVNSCTSSYDLKYGIGSGGGLPWNVININDALTMAVPHFFEFNVVNQNGNAMLTEGEGHFAYDNASTIGCGFTTTACNPDFKNYIFCIVGPIKPASSPVYTIGNKCTTNSHCTKTETPICDIPSGLCTRNTKTTPPVTRPPTTTSSTTKAPTPTPQSYSGCSTGNGISTWNNVARDFALQLINDKRSQIANGTFTMSNGAIAPPAKNMNKLTYSCEYENAAQSFVNTCNGSYLLPNTFGFTLGFGWVVSSISDALTMGVPYYFGFNVANQNGSAMLTDGNVHFAYDNAKTVGCGFTTTPCNSDIKTSLFCMVGPLKPASSPVYTIGSKCTANNQCTKPDSPTCDIPSGLCIAAPPVPTTTSTTTTTTKAPTPTPQSYSGCSTGNGISTWNNVARDFAPQLINDKRSQIANGTFTMSNGAIAPPAKNMNKLTYSCEYENAAQSFVNTCNGSYLLPNTFGFTLGFGWVVSSISDALTMGVPYYFGFSVANQNGSAILTDGNVHFAYDNAKSVGCGFTTTPCDADIKTSLFCMVGPLKPESSPVYTIGSKCTANSQCTKPDSPTCDIPSGLCITTATTTTPATLTFYDDLIFKGETKTWTGSGNSCDNFLSDTFNDRVESVNTGNRCVMLYEHRDCQGESVKLDPTCGLAQGCCPYHSSLAQDCKNFVNKASSHKLC